MTKHDDNALEHPLIAILQAVHSNYNSVHSYKLTRTSRQPNAEPANIPLAISRNEDGSLELVVDLGRDAGGTLDDLEAWAKQGIIGELNPRDVEYSWKSGGDPKYSPDDWGPSARPYGYTAVHNHESSYKRVTITLSPEQQKSFEPAVTELYETLIAKGSKEIDALKRELKETSRESVKEVLDKDIERETLALEARGRTLENVRAIFKAEHVANATESFVNAANSYLNDTLEDIMMPIGLGQHVALHYMLQDPKIVSHLLANQPDEIDVNPYRFLNADVKPYLQEISGLIAQHFGHIENHEAAKAALQKLGDSLVDNEQVKLSVRAVGDRLQKGREGLDGPQ